MVRQQLPRAPLTTLTPLALAPHRSGGLSHAPRRLPVTAIPAPPWVRMLQAHADEAERDLATRAVSRDIARAAYEDVVGPHQQTHRKDT